MFLYHYYDKKIGPFMNLSELSSDEANAVLSEIKKEKPNVQCAQRDLHTVIHIQHLVRGQEMMIGKNIAESFTLTMRYWK